MISDLLFQTFLLHLVSLLIVVDVKHLQHIDILDAILHFAVDETDQFLLDGGLEVEDEGQVHKIEADAVLVEVVLDYFQLHP